ncbi:MAG: hypothetical protein H6624_00025 [Bdellovibrionaceae bacterium]|nr:hypothetical protein [Bdellovibrionales bacterium]MCB9082692.1 hypothetical protein [Pseudobdellovibrionaceae bacterium]
MPRTLLPTLAAALMFAPSKAQACTVCGFGQDGSQMAFLLTTILMTTMPLAFIVAAVFYIRKMVKARSHEEA